MLLDLIRWLFDRSLGPPGPDGNWEPWVSIVFHLANLLIGLAQLSIPIHVALNWKYRRDGVSPYLFWSAVVFIPMSAISRLVRAAEVCGPLCHLIAVLDSITAAITIFSAVQFPALVRHIFKLPSRAELHRVLNQLQNEILAKELKRLRDQEKYDALMKELAIQQDIIKHQVWFMEKDAALDSIERANAILNVGKEVADGS